MATEFNEALELAKAKYPYRINHYEEYADYYVFDHNDGVERTGGTLSPIVIRKSDGVALNYEPIFFNLDADAEDVGEIIAEGSI